MWHCPLDIVVRRGCVVIASKKVGLGEGGLTPPPLPLPSFPLWSRPSSSQSSVLAFQAYATMPDFLISPFARNLPVFLHFSFLLVPSLEH